MSRRRQPQPLATTATLALCPHPAPELGRHGALRQPAHGHRPDEVATNTPRRDHLVKRMAVGAIGCAPKSGKEPRRPQIWATACSLSASPQVRARCRANPPSREHRARGGPPPWSAERAPPAASQPAATNAALIWSIQNRRRDDRPHHIAHLASTRHP